MEEAKIRKGTRQRRPHACKGIRRPLPKKVHRPATDLLRSPAYLAMVIRNDQEEVPESQPLVNAGEIDSR